MDRGIHIMVSNGTPSRVGQLILAGEVVDAEPALPRALRVLDGHILSVVLHGQGIYRYADGRQVAIGAGTVTTVRPGEPHWYGTAPGDRWSELFAVFSGPVFDTLARIGVLPASGPRTPRQTQPAAVLRSVLRDPAAAPAAAERQLLSLAAWLSDANQVPYEAPSPPIADAVSRLTRDFAEPLDMREVARSVGLSYRTFRRRFTDELGQAPLAYRTARRLACAATLLETTDLTLKAIADSLGYYDEFYLSRHFRAHFGLAPSDYRGTRRR